MTSLTTSLGSGVPQTDEAQAARKFGTAWIAAALAVAVCAFVAVIGADAYWLAALGREIAAGGIPDGVPFASALSSGWENVPVLAELVFHWLEAGLGDQGLLLAQVVAVAILFACLAADIRLAGAGDAAGGVVLLLLFFGAFPALAVVRAQLFSVALFGVLLVLLRSEARAPSRRIWLLVPLVALWSNLHGAVLAGLAVAGAYLLLGRLRRDPVTAVAVLAVSCLALLATPSLWRTPDYYLGVLGNEAARRGLGLWGRLSLTSTVGVAFVLVAVVLLVFAIRSRPALWERVALLGLAVMTAQSARHGVWLASFAATPAAVGLGGDATSRFRVSPRAGLALVGLLAALAAVSIAGKPRDSDSAAVVRQAVEIAQGTPILAEDKFAEEVALEGGTVWIGNPIDAFAERDQNLYLDWLEGLPAGDAALAKAPRAVVTREDGEAERRLAGNVAFREIGRAGKAVLYARIASS